MRRRYLAPSIWEMPQRPSFTCSENACKRLKKAGALILELLLRPKELEIRCAFSVARSREQLASKAAWQPEGRRLLRAQLEDEEADAMDAMWCGYAWIQFQIYRPLPAAPFEPRGKPEATDFTHFIVILCLSGCLVHGSSQG